MTDRATDMARIHAQRYASEMFQLLESEAPQDDGAAYWERLHKLIMEKVPPSPAVPRHTVEPMTEDEAEQFERTVVTFGIHAGKTVREIPAAYWLGITEGAFQKKLVRYLKSRRFERRQAS